MPAEDQSPVSRWRVILRRTDQICCAGLIALALAWMSATWVYQGGLQGRLINIETAESRPLLFQLDMNRADWPEWSVLPGIGETLAKRIVDFRQKNGPFHGPQDLLRVRGIGPRTLDRIRSYLLPIAEPDSKDGTKNLGVQDKKRRNA